MGRHKGYARDALIMAALPLFRAHGFAGTSTQMLVDALAVNRNTMYAAFGSKQGLFDAALARYWDLAMTATLGPLEAADADLDTIAACFAGFAVDAGGPSAGLGCLLCNTAVELGGADPGGQAFVARYLTRMQAAFAHALANARRAGQLAAGVDVDDQAQLLTATTLGVFVLVRARAAPAIVRGAARGVARQLTALRRARRRRPRRA